VAGGSNTTKRGQVPGGLGLKLLCEFIDLNDGYIQIVSDAGYWRRENGKTVTAQLRHPFPSTVVGMEINTADTNSYELASGLSAVDIFEVVIMQKELTISIFEIVGSPLCVASNDGQKVYDRLVVTLKEGRSATLSFHNISTLTLAFLNAAIGQLYGAFSEEQIRSLLKVSGYAA